MSLDNFIEKLAVSPEPIRAQAAAELSTALDKLSGCISSAAFPGWCQRLRSLLESYASTKRPGQVKVIIQEIGLHYADLQKLSSDSLAGQNASVEFGIDGIIASATKAQDLRNLLESLVSQIEELLRPPIIDEIPVGLASRLDALSRMIKANSRATVGPLGAVARFAANLAPELLNEVLSKCPGAKPVIDAIRKTMGEVEVKHDLLNDEVDALLKSAFAQFSQSSGARPLLENRPAANPLALPEQAESSDEP